MAAPGTFVLDDGTNSQIRQPASGDLDLRVVGDRIETLLEASSAGGTVARERAEELVRLVSDLYGGGLERMMEILYQQGVLTDAVLAELAGDDLIASLLLVHGLHPDDVTTRIERALDSVRPYLDSHGGNVQLLGISDDGVVSLQLLGSCDGCASSAATMSLAVEDAISQAAPEVTGFDVRSQDVRSQQPAAPAGRGLIPLTVVPHATPSEPAGPANWHPLTGADSMSAGEVLEMTVAHVPIVLCRNGNDLLAFRDSCARCCSALGSGSLERRLGGSSGSAVLVCPSCRAHFDVRRAGVGLDGDGHLEPLPVLTRAGRYEIALPATAIPAARLESR